MAIIQNNWVNRQNGKKKSVERARGFEPLTSTLEKLHSTTELSPHKYQSLIILYFTISNVKINVLSKIYESNI